MQVEAEDSQGELCEQAPLGREFWPIQDSRMSNFAAQRGSTQNSPKGQDSAVCRGAR